MTGDEFVRLVLERMRDVLGPAGFGKKGLGFHSKGGDVTLVVQLQRSTSSTKDRPIVTVNLGALSTTLRDRLGYPRKTPTVWDCHWRERIGHLQSPPSDRWWTLGSETEAVAAGGEIAATLRDAGLPLLRSVDTTEKLRSLWQGGMGPGLTDMERHDFLAALARPS